MRIVLWIGNESNQKALANKIHEKFPLCGIVTESRKSKSHITIAKIFEKIIENIFLKKIGRAWYDMLDFFEKENPLYPPVPLMDTENINNGSVWGFTKELLPDLIIVSGTRMIKNRLLSLAPTIGIMNLHTGLSPYVKGGPNCTNWCISTNQFHLIGNTIMWIDKGIDTGNIITTEFTDFDGTESLSGLHIKVMCHAHNLYLRSIEKISQGEKISVKQGDICLGKTYYSKEWGLRQKLQLVRNFAQIRKLVTNGEIDRKRKCIKTVPLF